MINNFDEIAIRNFASIISDMLTHKEIANHLSISGIEDVAPNGNKIERIYQALVLRQKRDRCGNNVLGFILNSSLRNHAAQAA